MGLFCNECQTTATFLLFSPKFWWHRMQDSMNSMSKPICSYPKPDGVQEESGWTFYLEDFLTNNEEHSYSSSGFGSSSLVSDAASSAAKKGVDNDKLDGSYLNRTCMTLSFKKRKTKGGLVNDSLEDTASSPVNSPKVRNSKSPKVSHLNYLGINSKEKTNLEMPQEGGSTSGHHRTEEFQTNDADEISFIGRNGDCTELRKRGRCLVPVSALVNYFG